MVSIHSYHGSLSELTVWKCVKAYGILTSPLIAHPYSIVVPFILYPGARPEVWVGDSVRWVLFCVSFTIDLLHDSCGILFVWFLLSCSIPLVNRQM
ncbi:hypothetical protein IE53DRAFT_18290 [Violaceomyces palustris]|uniref:Uncharacterized protein n=1 Tax=Violaceomyces palustris TaxID=1673888 RepID=A0ACD0P244_9BASI|nr:hypothetical protein IE53DRAFT_18290 [Violaceomyces palustris]